MKTLANWGLGNCVVMKEVKHLDMVVEKILHLSIETPRVEISLNWKGIAPSTLHT